MARRRYQQGSLTIRGKRRKVWVARWREDVIRIDGSRGRVQRSFILGLVGEIPTRRQARVLLEQRLRPLNQGVQRPQFAVRLREYIEGEWSPLVLPTLKRSTQRGYRLVLARHVLPYWGDWRLCDITKSDVQRFVAEEFRHGLAWQTVRNVWIVLSNVLRSAVEHGYLDANPAHGVRFPPEPPRQGPEILSADAFARLLTQLREPFKTMVALAALTGLRIGELLALPWTAVDLTSGTLQVTRSVYEGKFQQPKSTKSVRTIPIGPVTRHLLEDHRRRSIRTRPNDLVFPSQCGGPCHARNLLKRALRPAAKAAGIDQVSWHQFRHIHSSLLLDLGVPVRIAQEQLGHAAVETTLKVYTHVIPATHRHAVEQLESVLFPNVPKLDGHEETRKTVIQ